MKFCFLLIFFFLSNTLDIYAQPTKITGHWSAVSTGDTLMALEDFVHSGTVTFERIKSNTHKTYQWGGGLYTGMEFTKTGVFYFYNNVLCSSESSPQTNHLGETWEVKDQNTIVIRTEKKVYQAQIIEMTRKKLVLRFLP